MAQLLSHTQKTSRFPFCKESLSITFENDFTTRETIATVQDIEK